MGIEQHRTEIDAMKARRAALVAERDGLDDVAGADRIWAIENEMDSMDDRLGELGLSLDVLQ